MATVMAMTTILITMATTMTILMTTLAIMMARRDSDRHMLSVGVAVPF